MKHNSHIYVAYKAIEFMYEGLYNLYYPSGGKATGKKRTDLRREGKVLERLMQFHKGRVLEASWAPDDILNDKREYHTFKLFTERDFTDAKIFATETYKSNGNVYYRARGCGGLAFKIDHLSKIINDIIKLRNYNDSYSMEHIMYMFLMLSHYVVDAHVPMHCDIRDDKPSENKPQEGIYYEEYDWHAKLEEEWEKACTCRALAEDIPGMENADKYGADNELAGYVNFDPLSSTDRKDIKTYVYHRRTLMEHAVDICIKSKERSLQLFDIADPGRYDEELFKTMTREIVADSIGNLISIWVCMWVCD